MAINCDSGLWVCGRNLAGLYVILNILAWFFVVRCFVWVYCWSARVHFATAATRTAWSPSVCYGKTSFLSMRGITGVFSAIWRKDLREYSHACFRTKDLLCEQQESAKKKDKH